MPKRGRPRTQWRDGRGHGEHAAGSTARHVPSGQGAAHPHQQGGQSEGAAQAQGSRRAVLEDLAQAETRGRHAAQGGEEARREGEDHERERPRKAKEARGQGAQAREEEELVQDEANQNQVHVDSINRPYTLTYSILLQTLILYPSQ